MLHREPLPTITVILPAWNAERTIERALLSVLNQTSPSWALVVVDDGSSDSTLAKTLTVVDGDPRITVVAQENGGVASARNRGLSIVRTPYVAFLDSDDELAPAFIQRMSEFIEVNPGYDIYHPNLVQVGRSGESSLFLDETAVREHGFVDMLSRCVIAAGGTVVSSAALRDAGGFSPGIHCEDYDLWLRMTANGHKALFTPQQLYTYHQDDEDRRSADAVSGARDLVLSMNNLLQSGALDSEQSALLESAIIVKRRELGRASAHGELERQAETFRLSLESVFGKKVGCLLLRAAHAVSWMVRPLRRWLVTRGGADSQGIESQSNQVDSIESDGENGGHIG